MTKPIRVTLLLSALMLTISPVMAQNATPLNRAKRIQDPGVSQRKLRSDQRLNRAPRFGALLAKHPKGVRVRFVLPFSPAANLGLKTGDIIAKAFGKPIASPKDLQKLLSARRRGDNISLEVAKEDGWLDTIKGRLGRRSFKRLQHKTGRFVLAVVLVEFADAKHNPQFKVKDWEQSLFSRNSYNKKSPSGDNVFGSMADYYHENSAGRFQLTGKVHHWVQLPQKKAFYDKLATDPLRGQPQFLGKALDMVIAREGKNVFANVDGIAFVNAGSRGQYGRILWPHSAVFFHKGRSYDYYVMEEGGKSFAGIGTHVHEFGHVLGLPDKYGLGRRTGLGCFCVMAVGHRGKAYTKVPMEAPEKSREDAAKEIIKKNIDQIRKTLEDNLPFLKRKKAPHVLPKIPGRALINRRPLHFCVECKERFGWVDPIVLDPKSKQIIRLPSVEGNAKAVAKILLDPKGREYYLLEYRRKHKFNTGIPRSGLLIWHVGDPTAPMKNFVPFRMLDLEKAHGKDSLDSAYRAPESIPFPFGKNNRFTPSSKPSSKSIRRDAYKVWITDIKEVDGHLEFKFGHKK
ncbi:MAG: PDZ domain-containing protein [Planctomycetota bacterium]|nr:PDZ domain-containing protein [Planctomycetota bacterium]